MSERIDRFCDNLRGQLNTVEDRLGQVKSSLSAVREDTEATLRSKIEQVKASWDAGQQEVEAARDKLKARIEERGAETQAQIEEWRSKREKEKLQRRAESAENYAAAAMVVSMATVQEAEISMLEAVEARRLADEAAGEPAEG